MKLCIQVEINDNAKLDEIGYALRKAAEFAESDILLSGALDVDENRNITYGMEVACVKDACIFRPD